MTPKGTKATKSAEGKSVVQVVRPFINFGRFFGISPFRIEITLDSHSTCIDPTLLIWSLLVIGIYSACVFLAILEETNPEADTTIGNRFIEVDLYVRIFISCTLQLSLYISLFFNTKSYSGTLFLLTKVDEGFATLGRRLDHSKSKRMLVAIVVIYFVINMTYMFVNEGINMYYGLISSYAVAVVLYLPSFVITLVACISNAVLFVMCKYVALLRAVLVMARKDRKKKFLNASLWTSRGALLRRNAIIKDGRPIKGDTDDMISYKRINKTRDIYDKIMDCCDTFANAYNSKFLIIMAGCFLLIVYNEFNAMISFVTVLNGDSTQFSVLLFSSQQFVQYFAVLLTVTYFCNRLEVETEKLSTIVNRFMIEETDEAISNELHRFSSYLLNRSPVLTAAGLFKINNTFIFTVVGASTMYIIIMVQFSTMSNTNLENLNNTIY